eukprot:snap_masked-scaffold_87-processed-gene-0.22-mRNA-1 protein AED:1.00 eAED:1.00 QI:0/0/0/0/1/1/2/0/90
MKIQTQGSRFYIWKKLQDFSFHKKGRNLGSRIYISKKTSSSIFFKNKRFAINFLKKVQEFIFQRRRNIWFQEFIFQDKGGFRIQGLYKQE